MSIITLTTDFGNGSPYAAAVKGVILSINPAAMIVDITHGIPPQDVRAAAITLDDVAPHFPPGTIHVAVVDPGVGTERAILYAQIGAQQFVAPDNGVLSYLMARTPPDCVIRLSNPEFWLQPVSSTFHGRDIMAPVAARLSLGLDPERLGTLENQVVMLSRPAVRQAPGRLDGIVQAIDSFGNLVTNITTEMIAGRPTDRRVCIACGIFETWGIFRTYGDQEPGLLIALVGSSGRLELAIVGDNAAQRLGLEVGTHVVLAWE